MLGKTTRFAIVLALCIAVSVHAVCDPACQSRGNADDQTCQNTCKLAGVGPDPPIIDLEDFPDGGKIAAAIDENNDDYDICQDCHWHFLADPARGVTLSIDDINMKEGDVLKIYDGSSEDAPLMAELNNENRDELTAEERQYTSSGREMYVTFESDNSRNQNDMIGFKASYAESRQSDDLTGGQIVLIVVGGLAVAGVGFFAYKNRDSVFKRRDTDFTKGTM